MTRKLQSKLLNHHILINQSINHNQQKSLTTWTYKKKKQGANIILDKQYNWVRNIGLKKVRKGWVKICLMIQKT
jgi:hypothetical protein